MEGHGVDATEHVDVIAAELGLTFPSLPWVQPDPDEPAEYALFTHVCADGNQYTAVLPASGPGAWWWEGKALRPSISCLECDCHGWWDGDSWRPA